jgi:hypothetical protein
MVCSVLRFSVTTKTTLANNKTKEQVIESEASYPFVGITNESQWPEVLFLPLPSSLPLTNFKPRLPASYWLLMLLKMTN